MPYRGLLHTEPLPLKQSTADLYLHRRHSNTVLSQSLWGLWVLVHIRFVWALWELLVGVEFDSKREFAPPTLSLGLLLCFWMWGLSHRCRSSSVQFQQHKRRLYTSTSPDGQYRNQIYYILCTQRWISSIQLAKTRPRADCGSDHEHFIPKFRLKWKKVGKTTRSFRYDLNQIPCIIQWKRQIDSRS